MPIWLIIAIVAYILVGFIVALRENYWEYWAPILDAAFFWVCVLVWPILAVCSRPSGQDRLHEKEKS
jgi:uncharacterized membrane protein YhaH (DUF805 family)